jgi:hypothetical protein
VVLRGGTRTVAPKSGRGVSRSAFAASIGEPQLWQNAFSSLTAVPHLGQLIIDLIRPPFRLEPLHAGRRATENLLTERC